MSSCPCVETVQGSLLIPVHVEREVQLRGRNLWLFQVCLPIQLSAFPRAAWLCESLPKPLKAGRGHRQLQPSSLTQLFWGRGCLQPSGPSFPFYLNSVSFAPRMARGAASVCWS